MKLMIVADKNMVDINTKTKDKIDDFCFGLVKNMYGDQHGVGIQVNDDTKEEKLLVMCNKISAAILEYLKEE